MIPKSLHPFFWDIEIESFDPRAHSDYTIERILEFGDSTAVHWLEKEFSEEQIATVIRNTRRLSPKSATFWALVYEIPAGEVTALL